VDVNLRTNDGHSSLLVAVLNQQPSVVEALLARSATVGRKDSDVDGMSVLHAACQHDCLAVVKLLLEAGAPVNQQDRKGWTPLHFIAENDFVGLCLHLYITCRVRK